MIYGITVTVLRVPRISHNRYSFLLLLTGSSHRKNLSIWDFLNHVAQVQLQKVKGQMGTLKNLEGDPLRKPKREKHSNMATASHLNQK